MLCLPLTPHAVGVGEGLNMGTTQVNLQLGSPVYRQDAGAAACEAREALNGVPGAGPTGARSRSQWSQSGVTDGLGLRHWELF
jgi:hypothetical protein